MSYNHHAWSWSSLLASHFHPNVKQESLSTISGHYSFSWIRKRYIANIIIYRIIKDSEYCRNEKWLFSLCLLKLITNYSEKFVRRSIQTIVIKLLFQVDFCSLSDRFTTLSSHKSSAWTTSNWLHVCMLITRLAMRSSLALRSRSKKIDFLENRHLCAINDASFNHTNQVEIHSLLIPENFAKPFQ